MAMNCAFWNYCTESYTTSPKCPLGDELLMNHGTHEKKNERQKIIINTELCITMFEYTNIIVISAALRLFWAPHSGTERTRKQN